MIKKYIKKEASVKGPLFITEGERISERRASNSSLFWS